MMVFCKITYLELHNYNATSYNYIITVCIFMLSWNGFSDDNFARSKNIILLYSLLSSIVWIDLYEITSAIS
jgi:hypothetical protein